MKKILLFVTLFVMMATLVAAIPTFYFKQGDVVDLKVPCSNDGAVCSASAICNLTVNYPNGSTMINNQPMTNNQAYHSYTIPDSAVLGEHMTTTFCVDGSDYGYNTFTFEINLKGSKQSETLPLGMYIMIGIIVFAYLYSSFKLDADHIHAKFILFFIGLGNAVGGLFLAFFMAQNYTSDANAILTFGMINILTLIGVFWFFMRVFLWKRTVQFGLKGEDKNN